MDMCAIIRHTPYPWQVSEGPNTYYHIWTYNPRFYSQAHQGSSERGSLNFISIPYMDRISEWQGCSDLDKAAFITR